MDIDIEFSDGSHTALRDVAVSDYYLLVESLDSEVVAFAPMLASRHPRVIAVGEGIVIIQYLRNKSVVIYKTPHVIKLFKLS